MPHTLQLTSRLTYSSIHTASTLNATIFTLTSYTLTSYTSKQPASHLHHPGQLQQHSLWQLHLQLHQ